MKLRVSHTTATLIHTSHNYLPVHQNLHGLHTAAPCLLRIRVSWPKTLGSESLPEHHLCDVVIEHTMQLIQQNKDITDITSDNAIAPMTVTLSSPVWKILIIRRPSMTSMHCHGPLEVHRRCPWMQLHCLQKLYWAAGAQEHMLQQKRVRGSYRLCTTFRVS